MIITQISVRRYLQLEDAKGIECLSNADIFEQLALMGAKSTTWNEFSSTMASAIRLQAQFHKEVRLEREKEEVNAALIT
ncbi:hypothetical protein Tco_0342157 [Tanacetum coccineum]